MAASDHFQFRGAGGKAGIEIWRIEALTPTGWPKEKHGRFHESDSYIVLKSTPKPMSRALGYDLHFWLGKGTTHDEKGAVAYKTVELDESLGGAGPPTAWTTSLITSDCGKMQSLSIKWP